MLQVRGTPWARDRVALVTLRLWMLATLLCPAGAFARDERAVRTERALGPPLPMMRGDRDAAMRRFAQERLAATWYAPERDAFIVGPWVRAGAQRVARISQSWQGHPVWGGEVRVVLDTEDRVCLVNGRLLENLEPPESVIVSQAAARARAFAALGLEDRGWTVDAQLQVARRVDGDHLGWEIHIEEPRGGRAWRALVDSQDGSILEQDDLACHAPGLVYPSDPRQPVAQRELFGLAGDSTRLVHRYFSVENPSLDALEVPDHDFRFPDGHPLAARLREVNAYWHAQQYLDGFLGPLGYGGPPEPFLVRVGVQLDPYAALTSGRFVFLGLPVGTYTHDAALSDDILVHELQHAVTYGFGVGASGPRREALALHEGVSDFMAACHSEDPAIGEWLFRAFPGGATRVDRPADLFRYSNYDRVAFGAVSAGSGWANGMILSGALWDLRTAIGPTAEALVLRSLAYLPATPEWSQFVNAMLEADLELAAGAHVPAILAAFTAREIQGSLAIGISGPTASAPGIPAMFQATVEGVSAAPIEWSIRRYCGGGPCGDWLALASGPTVTVAETTDFELRASVAGLLGNAESIRFINVLAPTLRLVGPPALLLGETRTFQAQANGVGPMSFDWWRTFDRVPSMRERVGSGSSVSVRTDAAFTLECRITDALGRRATQIQTIRLLDLTISAPTRAAPGESVLLQAVSTVPLDAFEFVWQARRFCAGALCASSPETLGVGAGISAAFATDVLVELSGTTSWGSRITSSWMLNVLWPRIDLLGPTVMSPRAAAVFVAGLVGVGPFEVQWWAREPGSGVSRPVGTGPALELRQSADFDLVGRVRDVLGREQEAVRRITVLEVVGVDAPSPRFALEAPSVAKASVRIRFQLPQATSARLVVLDVTGREVARLWDGPHEAGVDELVWHPPGLRDGMYFVRLEARGRMIARRLVWLRQ